MFLLTNAELLRKRQEANTTAFVLTQVAMEKKEKATVARAASSGIALTS